MKKRLMVIAMLSATMMGSMVSMTAATQPQPVQATVSATSMKSGLQQLLSRAEAISPSQVSAPSFAGLKQAIGLAKATLENPVSNNGNYNFATAVLRDYMALGSTQADHFALTYLVSSAAAVQAKDYSPASFARFDQAYKVAMTVNSNRQATQQQLNAQTNLLGQALEQLQYIAPATITGVAKVTYIKGYGIQVWDSYQHGQIVTNPNGTAKKLAHGTRWKVFATVQHDGHNWYNLGGDQWVDGNFVTVAS